MSLLLLSFFINASKTCLYLFYYLRFSLLVNKHLFTALLIFSVFSVFFIKSSFLVLVSKLPTLAISIVVNSYYTTQNLFYLSMVLHIIFFYIFIFTTVFTFFTTLCDWVHIYIMFYNVFVSFFILTSQYQKTFLILVEDAPIV